MLTELRGLYSIDISK